MKYCWNPQAPYLPFHGVRDGYIQISYFDIYSGWASHYRDVPHETSFARRATPLFVLLKVGSLAPQT